MLARHERRRLSRRINNVCFGLAFDVSRDAAVIIRIVVITREIVLLIDRY